MAALLEPLDATYYGFIDKSYSSGPDRPGNGSEL